MGFFDFLTGDPEIETTSQYEPSKQEKPIYDMAFQQLQNLMGQQQGYFPGQGYVGMGDETQQGMGSLMGAAGQVGGMFNPFMESWQRNLNASDISNNKNVQAMMAANEQSLNQNLSRNLLPSIQQGAVQAGGMNNARQGIAQGVAMGDTQNAIGQANARTQMDAYGMGLAAEQGAMDMSGQLAGLAGAPAQMMLGTGQIGEGYEAMALQDAMNRYYYPQQEAERKLAMGLSSLGSLRMGTQVGTAPNPNYQPLGQIALNLGTSAMSAGMFGNPGIGGVS